jgi:hypothetical protein
MQHLIDFLKLLVKDLPLFVAILNSEQLLRGFIQSIYDLFFIANEL